MIHILIFQDEMGQYADNDPAAFEEMSWILTLSIEVLAFEFALEHLILWELGLITWRILSFMNADLLVSYWQRKQLKWHMQLLTDGQVFPLPPFFPNCSKWWVLMTSHIIFLVMRKCLTDNIFTLRQWCSNNFPEAKEQLEHMYKEVNLFNFFILHMLILNSTMIFLTKASL